MRIAPIDWQAQSSRMRIFSPGAGRPVDISHAEGLSIYREAWRLDSFEPAGQRGKMLKNLEFFSDLWGLILICEKGEGKRNGN